MAEGWKNEGRMERGREEMIERWKGQGWERLRK